MLAAWTAKDEAALRALAAKDDPDPWLVADVLLSAGYPEAAQEYASLLDRSGTGRLSEYAREDRGRSRVDARREAVHTALRALAHGEPESALQALGDQSAAAPGVTCARALHTMGLALLSLGRHQDAARAFREAASLARSIGWLRQTAASLYQCGKVAHETGDFPVALAVNNGLLEVYASLEDPAGTAKTLANLAAAHSGLGDWKRARDLYQTARELRVSLGDREGVAIVDVNLGRALAAVGDLGAARERLRHGIDTLEDLGAESWRASGLLALSQVEWRSGDEGAARDALAVASEVAERIEDARLLGEAGLLHANISSNAGEDAAALDHCRRAIAAFRRLGDRACEARALAEAAGRTADLGDYVAGKALADRALELAADTASEDARGIALGVLSQLHLHLGNVARALDSAGACMEAFRGKTYEWIAVYNSAMLHYELGDSALATVHFDRAVELTAGNHPGVLVDAGLAHCRAGGLVRGRDYIEKGLAGWRRTGIRRMEARTLGILAYCDLLGGAWDEAVSGATAALRIMEQVGDRYGMCGALRTIAEGHRSAGRLDEAATASARSVECAIEGGWRLALADSLQVAASLALDRRNYAEAIGQSRNAVEELNLAMTGVDDPARLALRSRLGRLFAVGATAALGAADTPAAWYFSESGKATLLVDALRLRARGRDLGIPSALLQAEADARKGESRAIERLGSARAKGDRELARAARSDLQAARDRLSDVIASIQRTERRAASLLYPQVESLDSVRGRLSQDEAFVAYVDQGRTWLAIVATARQARLVQLGGDPGVAGLLADLSSSASRGIGAAVRRARTALIDSLGLEDGVRRVLVCPDGALVCVPFSLLLPGREVVCEPSGTTYGHLMDEIDVQGTGVLGIGDPDYRTGTQSGSGLAWPGSGLPALPATSGEVHAIATRTLLGSSASVHGLRGAIPEQVRWRAIHFACHALLDTERPAFSALMLSPDGTGSGLLTTQDVLRLRLPADLVVLSACETGVGRRFRGEGVVGLARSVMVAGARRVICSLWRVDDEATKALMVKFYELWNPKDGTKGMGTAAALKAAQEYVRNHPDHPKWKHPYYWAAWVLWGLPD